ncbi:response regulator [Xanthomonas citri pv. mangiferaeindicae LMG 941]|nr:response regulator [Xanthomonas citri pv. mangiferaeindicae LMG 941]
MPTRQTTTTHAVAAITQRWRLDLRCPHGGIHAALPALPVSLRLSRSRLPGLFDERHARG